MSSAQDFDRIVQDWLEVGPTQLADRVSEAARLGVRRTKQRQPLRRRVGWPARRTARLTAVAGGVVVLVAAAAFAMGSLQGRQAVGGPQSTPTPTATVVPSASAQMPARLVVSFHARSTERGTTDAASMDSVRRIVLRRLAAAGFVDPIVRFEDRNAVVVDVPFRSDDPVLEVGHTNVDARRIRSIVERRGELTFVPLPADRYGTIATGGPTGVIEGQPLPADAELRPLFTGSAIVAASPTTDQNAVPAVQFELDPTATKSFADYTRDHIGESFAIVLDGTVLSLPTIAAPIAKGSGVISMAAGPDPATQADDLVMFLRGGSLPLQLEYSGFSTTPVPSP
jgi:preprotein translocase subunit SecD